MKHLKRRILSAAALAVFSCLPALASQTRVAHQLPNAPIPDDTSATHNTTNLANNPVTPKVTYEFQNYLSPSPQGLGGRYNNETLFRLYLPVHAFGVTNIVRFYQPIDRKVLQPHGSTAGFGDLTIYDLSLRQQGKWTLGAGPLLVVPVGSHKNMTAGKWQAGAAGIFVHSAKSGLLGAVITYQHSFSGYGRDRPADELLTVQPQIRINLKNHYYLRSTGFWNLDWDSHVSEIPVGLGLGKVVTMQNKTTLNFYVEPDVSVYHEGVGSQVFQVLAGLNVQLPAGENLFGKHW